MALPKDLEQKKALEEQARKEREEALKGIALREERKKSAEIARIKKELDAAKQDLAKKEREKNNLEEEIKKTEDNKKNTETKIMLVTQETAKKSDTQNKNAESRGEEAQREIKKLEKEIREAEEEKKKWERKYADAAAIGEQARMAARKGQTEASLAGAQARTLQNTLMNKRTRMTDAARQYENARQLVARLERELQTTQRK